jgi:hypothetical protein
MFDPICIEVELSCVVCESLPRLANSRASIVWANIFLPHCVPMRDFKPS